MDHDQADLTATPPRFHPLPEKFHLLVRYEQQMHLLAHAAADRGDQAMLAVLDPVCDAVVAYRKGRAALLQALRAHAALLLENADRVDADMLVTDGDDLQNPAAEARAVAKHEARLGVLFASMEATAQLATSAMATLHQVRTQGTDTTGPTVPLLPVLQRLVRARASTDAWPHPHECVALYHAGLAMPVVNDMPVHAGLQVPPTAYVPTTRGEQLLAQHTKETR